MYSKAQEHKNNAGRKRIDPLILLKMLVLQQLHSLIDEEFEPQANDRRCFANQGLVGPKEPDIPLSPMSPAKLTSLLRRADPSSITNLLGRLGQI